MHIWHNLAQATALVEFCSSDINVPDNMIEDHRRITQPKIVNVSDIVHSSDKEEKGPWSAMQCFANGDA